MLSQVVSELLHPTLRTNEDWKTIMNETIHPASAVKSCFRCGSEFRTSDHARVCWQCRKPKDTPRNIATRQLTFREKQIVELVAQGKANKEIAFTLILTEGTIKEYLNRIFRKIHVTNRTELAIWSLTQTARTQSNAFESQPAFDNRSLAF